MEAHTNQMKKKYLSLIFGSLLLSSVFAQNNNQKAGEAERIISLSFNKEKGPLNTSFKECVGAGRANEGLRADWQQQLAIAKKECGFKFIRMHGLLTDDMVAARSKARGLSEADYMSGNLLKREVTAEDVAGAFTYLADATKTTAAVITVDGGNIEASLR